MAGKEQRMWDLTKIKTPEAIEEFKKLAQDQTIDPNYKNQYGEYFLWLAAFYGQPEMIQALLENHGKIININLAKEKDGTTPLYIACQEGHEGVVKLLLERNEIDINKPNNNNDTTPLYIACHNGHESVVKLMLASKHHSKIEIESKSYPKFDPLLRRYQTNPIKVNQEFRIELGMAGLNY